MSARRQRLETFAMDLAQTAIAHARLRRMPVFVLVDLANIIISTSLRKDLQESRSVVGCYLPDVDPRKIQADILCHIDELEQP